MILITSFFLLGVVILLLPSFTTSYVIGENKTVIKISHIKVTVLCDMNNLRTKSVFSVLCTYLVWGVHCVQSQDVLTLTDQFLKV